jgi:metal-responsive CopG/Arc/MetJ family transcriptional regulator
MTLMKRTYALPSELLGQFEQSVAAGKRSAVLSDLLREWLDRQRREKLRREVIEGCHAMTDVYLEMEQAYHPLEEEVQHALDLRSSAG